MSYMPKTKSAKKALRKSKKRRERNLIYKNRIKELFKKFEALIESSKLEEAKNLLPTLYKAIDKAKKAGVIKRGAANRKKSKAAKILNLALKKK
jgi:small subunit ribosomal protein S20